MSGKKDLAENADGAGREVANAEKEKLSRLKKRHRKEARKKRRALVVVLILAVGVLAVGAVLDVPYINVLRGAGSWMRERFSSGSEEEGMAPDYLYFTRPQGAGQLEDEVSVLVGVYAGEKDGVPSGEILGLALFTYDREEGRGEAYLIPEDSVAYDAAGEQTDLAQALQEERGRDLLRSTVSNLAGTEVDYLLLLEFWDAVKLMQALQPPAVQLSEQTILVNPLNGETDFLAPGVEIKDADRLFLYMLATDELETWPAFSTRLERTRAYLPGLFSILGREGLGAMEEMLPLSGDGLILEPGAGSEREEARYVASMLASYAELGEGRFAVKAVAAVEVLNGCGLPDLGRTVGDRLSSLGVPVAGTGGNAKVNVDGEEINDFTHEVSTIISRSRDPRVEAFARYLGVLLSVSDVVSDPGPGPEIILIAGRDMAS